MSKLKEISCEGCCFSTKIGGVQVGCKLDILNKLAKNGGTYILKDKYFSISGRICKSKRSEKWYSKYQEVYEPQLFLETAVNCSAIIEGAFLEDFKDTYNYLSDDEIMPSSYNIIYHGKGLTYEIMNIFKQEKNKNIKVPLFEEERDGYFVDEFIKTGVIKENYILYLKSEGIFPKNLLSRINNLINRDLKEVLMITGTDFKFFPKRLCQYFYFSNLENELVAAGHSDKIFTEDSI